MSKQVIRVEHPADGKGLWCSNGGGAERMINNHTQFKTINHRHCDPTKFPNLWQDKVLSEIANRAYDDDKNLENYFFAFRSLEQLATALTNDEIKECIDVLGFNILMLTVTDYYESDFQVIFRKESIVEKNDITFMFK